MEVRFAFALPALLQRALKLSDDRDALNNRLAWRVVSLPPQSGISFSLGWKLLLIHLSPLLVHRLQVLH
jgi:hypothetical protein